MRPARPIAAAALFLLAAGCGDDRVVVAFRPPPGARYAYDVEVEADSRSEIEGRAPEHTRDEVRLRADQRVLPDAGAAPSAGTRVRVDVRPAGGAAAGPASTLVVVLDRAAQLVRVEPAQGHPADLPGVLGLAEIFPAAAGVPPGPLAPGQAWTVDAPVQLPGMAPGHLRGRGRLVELGVVGGRAVGVVETVTELTVDRTRQTPTGPLRIRGVQTTRSRARHAVDGGTVERAESVTHGEFAVDLLPPGGVDPALAVHGRISVTVRSTTRRVG